MRVIRSTVLHLLGAREARLVLESAPRSLAGLPTDTLRRRAEQARFLCSGYRQMAQARRHAGAGHPEQRGAGAPQLQEAECKAELMAQALGRYERALALRQSQLLPRRAGPAAPRGVAQLSAFGERTLPDVQVGARDVRVAPAPRRRPARGARPRPPPSGRA